MIETNDALANLTFTQWFCMNRLKRSIYQMVHSNGRLADVVYRAAYPIKDVLMRLRNWRAKRDNIQAEELYEYRHIAAGSDLIVGVTNVCNARCVFCAYPRAMDSKDLKGGVMPFILFKKIVDEWKSLGGSRIDLTHTVANALIDFRSRRKNQLCSSSGRHQKGVVYYQRYFIE